MISEIFERICWFFAGAALTMALLTGVFSTKVPAGSVDTDGYELKKTWHCF